MKPTKLKMLAQEEADLRMCGIAIPGRLVVGAGTGAITEIVAAVAKIILIKRLVTNAKTTNHNIKRNN